MYLNSNSRKVIFILKHQKILNFFTGLVLQWCKLSLKCKKLSTGYFSVIFLNNIRCPLCLIFCHLQTSTTHTAVCPALLNPRGPRGSTSRCFVPVQRGIEWGALFKYDQSWRIYLDLVCDWVHQDCNGGWRSCVPSTSKQMIAKKKRLLTFQDK